jgi:methionyl-tRNA formyltransferase
MTSIVEGDCKSGSAMTDRVDRNDAQNETKIVFMGSPQFAVPSLKALIENNYNVVAVVTVPDKPKGRGLKLEASEVKKVAELYNIPVLQPEKMKDKLFVQEMEKIDPSIIVVVAFRILPPEIYKLAKLGAFNLHASLLPKYRGAAPINWAIINGETKTGITTFFLEDKVDTGSIIFQEEIDINENESYGDIYDKLSLLGASLIIKTIDAIIDNKASTNIQEEANITPAPKIFKNDCLINWELPSKVIHNHIRGLSPYPTAFTRYENKNVKIFKSELSNKKSNRKAGYISSSKSEILVSSADYELKILELQIEGKKRLKSEEFLRGFHFPENSCFY